MASDIGMRSVDRVCDILDAVSDERGDGTLGYIARRTALPKSSVLRYLVALESRQYVERDGAASIYRPGVSLRAPSNRRVDRLVELASPILEELRGSLSETVNLGILDRTEVVHSLVFDAPHMMRLAAHIGERGSLHSTALGKAMGAWLDESRVRAIVSATGLPPLTPSTITNLDDLFTEFSTIRQQGYALDDEENEAGGRCVAVNISRMPFPAAISVSAPIARMPMNKVPRVAKDLARAIEKMRPDLDREFRQIALPGVD